MAILNQKRILNLIPKTSAPVTIHVSQGDVGTEIEFTLVKGDELFVNTGSLTASVHGVREDGANFGAFACTLSGSSVKFPLHSEMTMVKGSAIAEIVLVDSQGNKVGSANFGIMVEESVFPLGVTYDNDVSVYESILAYVQTIPAQVTQDYNTKINAETAARQAADSSLNEALTNEASVRSSADSLLGTRIDEIIAPSGEAPSAAEVTDARVGADGTIHSSLGDAIRSQITNVNSNANNIGEVTNKCFEAFNVSVSALEQGAWTYNEKVNSPRGIRNKHRIRIRKHDVIKINTNNQYINMALMANETGNTVAERPFDGYVTSSDTIEYEFQNDGYLVFTIMTAASYSAASNITPSDYAMEISISYADFLYKNNNFVKDAISSDVYVLTSDNLIQGGNIKQVVNKEQISVSVGDIIHCTPKDYIQILIYSDANSATSVEHYGYTNEPFEYVVRHSGVMSFIIMNNSSYNDATALSPGYIKTELYIDRFAHNKFEKAYDTIESFFDIVNNGMLEQGGWTNTTEKNTSTKQISNIVGIPVNEGDIIHWIPNGELYCKFLIYQNVTDTSAIEATDYVTSQTEFIYGVRNKGILYFIIMNNRVYNDATDITVNDYNNSLLFIEKRGVNTDSDYSIDIAQMRRPVRISTIGAGRNNQSFCIYDEHFYTTDGNSVYKLDKKLNIVSYVQDLVLGHANSFQRGNKLSNYAYASATFSPYVIAFNLDTMERDDDYTISLPQDIFYQEGAVTSTCAVDDRNGILYAFVQPRQYQNVSEVHFIKYDYINDEVLFDRILDREFSAQQGVDYYEGKIYACYGLGTSESPNGWVVYDTNGNIIYEWVLNSVANLEAENICVDRDEGGVYIMTAVSGVIYKLE